MDQLTHGSINSWIQARSRIIHLHIVSSDALQNPALNRAPNPAGTCMFAMIYKHSCAYTCMQMHKYGYKVHGFVPGTPTIIGSSKYIRATAPPSASTGTKRGGLPFFFSREQKCVKGRSKLAEGWRQSAGLLTL